MPSGATRAGRRDPLQQHQREQPDGLGLVGHQLDQQPAEADRLGAAVARRGSSPDAAA